MKEVRYTLEVLESANEFMKQVEFKEVESIYQCTTFRELEEMFESEIFYADGLSESVVEAINQEPDFKLELYMFDGWFVALHANPYKGGE